MEKALRETQTLCAGCSKAEPKNFARRRPADVQNLISCRRSLQTQFGEDQCTQFRVIVVTDPQTNKPTNTNKRTHRQDRLQYTALLSLVCSVIKDGLYTRQLLLCDSSIACLL